MIKKKYTDNDSTTVSVLDSFEAYEMCCLSEINLPLNNGNIPLGESELSSLLTRSLNVFLLNKIKGNLRLSDKHFKDVTVKEFMKNITHVNADTIIGHEVFDYNDPEYQKYADFKEAEYSTV